MTRPLVAVLVASAFLALAPRVRADDDPEERAVIATQPGTLRNVEQVDVAVRWGPVSVRGAGWGYVRVDLLNRDRVARDAVLRLRPEWGAEARDGERVTRRVRLAAGARLRTWVPVPARFVSPTLEVAVAGGESYRFAASTRGTDMQWVVLVVAEGARVAALGGPLDKAMETAFASVAAGSRGDVVEQASASAEDLPPSWAWISAASIVLVDGRASGLSDPERQRTLVRTVHAGGTAAVVDAGALPKGPLAELVAAAGPGDVAAVEHGLGTLIAVPAGSLSAATAARVVAKWAGSGTGTTPPTWTAATHPLALRDVVPTSFRGVEAVPGVGRPPVRGFFVSLVAFAVLAGPVAYVMLRRRRRLTLLLAVVPALGILFAAAILGWGLLSEGLGSRGTVRSFTALDQRRHEASTVAMRTLFTSFGPESLSVSPDTVLVGELTPYRPWERADGAVAPIRLDVDAARVDGAALPSRVVTPFATTTQGRARERLQFRRGADGRYEAVGGEGFAPLPGPGRLVLRAPDGTWHVGGAGAPLAPVSQADATAAVAAIVGESTRLREPDDDEGDPLDRDPFGYGYRWGRSRMEAALEAGRSKESLAGWFSRRTEDPLPPGSYLAQTTRAPLFDDLGLDVRWLSEVHVVRGVLAPDDVDE